MNMTDFGSALLQVHLIEYSRTDRAFRVRSLGDSIFSNLQSFCSGRLGDFVPISAFASREMAVEACAEWRKNHEAD
jgi:hypothetical protein